MSYPFMEATRPHHYGLEQAECAGCGRKVGWWIKAPRGIYCGPCTDLMKSRGWDTNEQTHSPAADALPNLPPAGEQAP